MRYRNTTYRIEESKAGKFFGIIYFMHWTKGGDRIGRWYYTPSTDAIGEANERTRAAIRGLVKGFDMGGVVLPFTGDLDPAAPDVARKVDA